MTPAQDTYDMDHELPNVIFALGSHLLELTGLIIIVSIYQPYFLVGAVRLLSLSKHATVTRSCMLVQGL